MIPKTFREPKFSRSVANKRGIRHTPESIGASGDFREGGVEGVEDLSAATENPPFDAFVLWSGPPEVLDIAGYGANVRDVVTGVWIWLRL